MALRCRAEGADPDSTSLRAASRAYSKALNLLRSHLETVNDATLAIAGLLVLYETLMVEDTPTRLKNCRAHWSGITALLFTRRRTGGGATSELSRSMLYSMFVCWCSIPIARGLPSPFEDAAWLDVDFASFHQVPDDTIKLRKLAYQTMMSVPRLIYYVRELRQYNQADQQPRDTANHSVELAKKLLGLEDERSESALLHRVKVLPITSSVDRDIVPTAFEFQSMTDFGAATFYWISRLAVIKLCQRLVRLSTLDPLEHELSSSKWDRDQQRMTANALMSWNFACTQGVLASAALKLLWLTAWGALKDMDSFRGMPISKVRAWFLPALNGPSYIYSLDSSDSSAHGWDAATEIMEGGPLSAGGPLKEFIAAFGVGPSGHDRD